VGSVSALRVPRRRLLIVCLTLGLATAAIPVAAASRWSLGSDADVQTHGQIDPSLEAAVGQATGGRLTTMHFYSRALGKVADYLVYLPAGYTPTQPLPAFYLLHGMPGKPVAFTVNADMEVRLEQLIRERQVNPMILVFPDGRIDGRVQSDSEWANTPSGRYESYVTNVVQNVDQRFGALGCRQQRAIAGLSAGAYGAANIGLHQDATFGLVQVWSGYFRETHNGVFADADRAVMAYNSPIDYVRTMRQTLERYPLRIFIYGGRDDPDTVQIPAMAQALKEEGAHESWAIYPGGHSWQTWTPHVDQMLIMASRDFSYPLGRLAPDCEPHMVSSGPLRRGDSIRQ
jgi:enterochelin esterase-like enzyme